MKRLLRSFCCGVVLLEIGGEKSIGIRISRGKRSFSVTRFSEYKNDPGYIVEKAAFREWNVKGTCEVDGSIYFYGPFHPGTALTSFLASPPEDPLPLIRTLTAAFTALPGQPYPVYANGILIDEETGSCLFLPPRIMDFLADQLNEEERKLIGRAYYSHNLEKEGNIVFFFSAVVHRLITGMYIEETDPEGDFRNNLKQGIFPPPHIMNPKLSEEISRFILDCLKQPDSVSPASFHKFVTEGENLEEPGLSREELERRMLKKENFIRGQDKLSKRRNFLKKHGWKLLVIIVAGVLAGIFGGRILWKAAAPPLSAGLNEREVIEMFYSEYSEFDHESMEELTVGDAGEEMIEKVLNLFVISRIRRAYEGSGSYVSAEDWIDQGKPVLENDPLIFGITDLTVERISGNSYEVTFTEILPGRMEEESPPAEGTGTDSGWVPPRIYEVKQKVSLGLQKEAWHITAIRELERIPID